jgi:hypothetical protein
VSNDDDVASKVEEHCFLKIAAVSIASFRLSDPRLKIQVCKTALNHAFLCPLTDYAFVSFDNSAMPLLSDSAPFAPVSCRKDRVASVAITSDQPVIAS